MTQQLQQEKSMSNSKFHFIVENPHSFQEWGYFIQFPCNYEDSPFQKHLLLFYPSKCMVQCTLKHLVPLTSVRNKTMHHLRQKERLNGMCKQTIFQLTSFIKYQKIYLNFKRSTKSHFEFVTQVFRKHSLECLFK